jgi:hypothetical protein
MVRSSREQQMPREGAGQLPALLLVKDSLPSGHLDRVGEQALRLAKQPMMHRFVLLPLLAGVIFCCLGIFLSLFILPLAGSGFEGAYALGTANEAHSDQGANNVYRAPLPDENYPFTPAVEVEKADNSPVNAGLLTILFLVASFFGATAGWLHTYAQGQGALCFSSLGVGEVLGRAREDYLPFLGVFRL